MIKTSGISEPIFSFFDEATLQELFVYYPYFYRVSIFINEKPETIIVNTPPLIAADAPHFDLNWLVDGWYRHNKNAHVLLPISKMETLTAWKFCREVLEGKCTHTFLPNPNDRSKMQVVKGFPIGLRDFFLTQGRHLTGCKTAPRPQAIKTMLRGDLDFA